MNTGKKALLASGRVGGGQQTILEYVQSILFLVKHSLKINYFSRSYSIGVLSEPNQPRRKKKEKKSHSSSAPSKLPIPPVGVEGLRSTCEITAQRHRLTKKPKHNHKTIRCFPSLHTLLPYTDDLFTAIPFTHYIMSGFQQKVTMHMNDKNTI